MGAGCAVTAAGSIYILILTFWLSFAFVAIDHAKVKGKLCLIICRSRTNILKSAAFSRLHFSFPGYELFATVSLPDPFTRCKMKPRIPTSSFPKIYLHIVRKSPRSAVASNVCTILYTSRFSCRCASSATAHNYTTNSDITRQTLRQSRNTYRATRLIQLRHNTS
jgi:hypothetical protein